LDLVEEEEQDMVHGLVGEICINFNLELIMLMLLVVKLVCGRKLVMPNVKIRRYGLEHRF
jgi:hypothetical protein